MKNGFIKIILLTAILIAGGFLLFNIKMVDIEFSKPEDATVTVVLVGDIMLDRGIELRIKENGGNWNWPFMEIANELKEADILFGNLEGPTSDKGENVGSIYSFRADPRVIEGLVYAGFDVLSLANNHAMDYGRQALEDTFLRLKNEGIAYVGGGLNEAESDSTIIKEVNGTKVAFLAFTDLCPPSWKADTENSGINCINEGDFEKIKNAVKTAKKISDVVIVSLHSGTEYSQTITSFQSGFAKAAIDSGADLIVGHHPHIAQKSEIYKGKYIFYSLGNFVFDQDFSEETMQGQMVKIIIEEKKIKEVFETDTFLNDNFQVSKIKTFELPKPAQALKPPESSPVISLSSAKPEQGDTFLIKILNISNVSNIAGSFGETKIDFFKSLSGNWMSIVGIDAKKTPGNYNLTVNLPDGQKLEKNVQVLKRNFPITVLAFTPELEEQGYNATTVQETLVSNDSVVLSQAFSASAPTAYFNTAFTTPLVKMINVGAFGNIRQSGDVSLQHLGVDLDASLGTPVYAINDGMVKTATKLINYGNTLIIDHGLGIFSLYLHLDEFTVQEGQMVKKDQIIAYSGNTGYSIEPHLHFSIKVNNASVDPLRFIEALQF